MVIQCHAGLGSVVVETASEPEDAPPGAVADDVRPIGVRVEVGRNLHLQLFGEARHRLPSVSYRMLLNFTRMIDPLDPLARSG